MSGTRTSNACLASLDVFILAGGLGTRIRPVLGDRPKLLAPVGGRPYLARLFDWLRRYGARRVVLGLGHQAQIVVDYLRAHPPRDLDVVVVVEPQPLGTAGAVRFARDKLKSDPVLAMNGDTFADADLCAFVAEHAAARAAGAVASVVCAEVSDAGRYGRVEIDDGGFIHHFVEKDAAFHGRALINAGVYLISMALLDEIAGGAAASLEHDVFECLPPKSLAAFPGRFAFIDIGTPESLAEADRFFAAGGATFAGGRE